MKRIILALLLVGGFITGSAQKHKNPAKHWVDSVYKSLSKEEKISQLMLIRAHSNLGQEHVEKVAEQITKYNVGGLVFFQGGPIRQANLTNYFQAIARTPLMVTIDGEWGLGMRLDSVTKFPYQLTLGALNNDKIVYDMGVAVGQQMKRIGVHVNFAPVVDVNNNPNNPVIGYRSFGEDKNKVADYGIAYMKGMQDQGIMACAKHFPGHGDTEVDSHYDLPVINKSLDQLDSLELYPFKKIFKAGVGSVMIAHLSIPSIDDEKNKPTSLSKNNVKELLRDELEYDGLTFTDALEMKGVTKFYPAGEAAVQAIIAGNDMLCLPDDVPAAIEAVKEAVQKKRIKQKEIDAKVKRILYAKYHLGLNSPQVIDTTNLVADLNAKTDDITRTVARNIMTVMSNENAILPLSAGKKVAYVGFGLKQLGAFGRKLSEEMPVDTFLVSYRNGDNTDWISDSIKKANYDAVVIGFHDYSYKPANNFNISETAMQLWRQLQGPKTITVLFGNVYAAKNFCYAPTLIAAYQDEEIYQTTAAEFLAGRFDAKGKIPVTVCEFKYGEGQVINRLTPEGFAPAWLKIDSIVHDGLKKKAYPGAVVLAVQDGRIKYHKAFGRYEFDRESLPVTLESIYDLASVTKTSATTVAIMKLYEEGKVSLDRSLGDYLPITRGTDKASLTIRDILLHQAGLNPFIPFYRETIDPNTKKPSRNLYSDKRYGNYIVPVAQDVWLRRDWNDTMMLRIVQSKLGPQNKYVYSDNDFILLGKIVEQVSGMPLDQYVRETFYKPLGMITTGFKAAERFGIERIVPTMEEGYFRNQLLRGYVHDEGAAMFGNVSGHAGLFSNAYDLSILYQMLLNKGSWNGVRYFKPETIELFTTYGSDISRRALGFDKPEKDNEDRKEPYPSQYASPATFGHTGFTGTAVWVDPQSRLVYIFLSNRVYNKNGNLLGSMNIRGKIQDAIYQAVKKEEAAQRTATSQTD